MTPDFDREIHCLFGLPFDAMSEHGRGSPKLLFAAVQTRTPCFVSTPNLNFVIAAQTRCCAFRDSVLHSDLSVADGMPLVWVARLLRIPIAERVAGSELFERLRAARGKPIRVFFFGGPDGVAKRASERLNAVAGGLRCVGFEAPGFGTIEEMSSEDQIARINESETDFVVVSLGARKGQAWIERNRERLRAPLISHLGAVVNFVAGTVDRAPSWMQRSGLEWLWRIREEPKLWRRYAGDAVAFARLLAVQALPYAVHIRRHRPTTFQLSAARVETRHTTQGVEIAMRGSWSAGNASPLREAFRTAVASGKRIRVDLGGVTYVDSGIVALLALLRAGCDRGGRSFQLVAVPRLVRRVVGYCGAGHVLEEVPKQSDADRGEESR